MALSNAERQRRWRARQAAERERKRRDRDRKRAERARAREAEVDSYPAAPDLPTDSLAAFCEALEVTQGDHEGELLTLLPWQREYLARVEASAGGELGLSIAAGGGKSTLLGAIAAAGVVGPLARRRADVIRAAGSFAQACLACLVFDAAHAFLVPLIEADPRRYRVLRSEQSALIGDRRTGAKLRAREANAGTLHGTAPALVLADEPAQWAPTKADRIYSALRSRLGKIPGARLLAIGTRPDDAQHWFARMLVRSGMVYAADPGADPFDAASWEAANPSLPHFPELRRVYEREASEAAADPSLLPEFLALRLNQGTSDTVIAVLIAAEAWQRCEVDLLPAATGVPVWGVDLSGGDALAAVACYYPDSGRLQALAAVPELPSLEERSRTDQAAAASLRASMRAPVSHTQASDTESRRS